MVNVFVRTNTPRTELPPRSRLYSLVPIGAGTPMVECLTSYINRLAWAYRISPRLLLAEEIIPHLSGSYYFRSYPGTISKFCHQEAMGINRLGESAADWSATIEGLTQQAGIQKLTLGEWAIGIPSRRLFRMTPGSCPACYSDWQEKKHPIHQPLIWMLQVVTFCTQHQRKLEDQCNHCQKRQPVFPGKTQPGHCSQCGAWLGLAVEIAKELEIDEEELTWQNWVVRIIEDLRTAYMSSEGVSWRRISTNLAACLEIKGEAARFSRLIGVSKRLISRWQHFEQTPSFQKVLEICYAAGISPLQLMGDTASMRNAIQTLSKHPRRHPVHHRLQVVNREEIREYLQAVLDGRKPICPMSQIEHEMGVGFRTIEGIFPLESSLVSKRYQAQQAQGWRQRIAQACDEVRQVASDLHAHGIYPGHDRVRSQLSIPSMMRKPEVRAAWRAVLCELGFRV